MPITLRDGAVALKSFHRMGDVRIFSKNLRASLFNDDLSNEPNFGRIHLAGQYLKHKNYPVDFICSWEHCFIGSRILSQIGIFLGLSLHLPYCILIISPGGQLYVMHIEFMSPGGNNALLVLKRIDTVRVVERFVDPLRFGRNCKNPY